MFEFVYNSLPKTQNYFCLILFRISNNWSPEYIYTSNFTIRWLQWRSLVSPAWGTVKEKRLSIFRPCCTLLQWFSINIPGRYEWMVKKATFKVAILFFFFFFGETGPSFIVQKAFYTFDKTWRSTGNTELCSVRSPDSFYTSFCIQKVSGDLHYLLAKKLVNTF